MDAINHINTHTLTFDANNYNWAPTPEYNRIFVRTIEAFRNQQLQKRGHVFLNEVLDDLAFTRTRAGALQGWLFNRDNPNPIALEFVEQNNTLEITIVTQGNIYNEI